MPFQTFGVGVTADSTLMNFICSSHTELSLTLSDLVPMIGSLGPDMNSIHYFTLILTDEADNVLEKELAFQFTEEFEGQDE